MTEKACDGIRWIFCPMQKWISSGQVVDIVEKTVDKEKKTVDNQKYGFWRTWLRHIGMFS